MKMLHVVNSLEVGGAENLLKELVPLLKTNGILPDILTLNGGKGLYRDSLVEQGIFVHSTGVENIYSIRQIFHLSKLLGKYDLVHTHLFPAQYWYAFSKILRGLRIPSVTTEHSTHNRRRDNPFFRPVDKLVYQQYHKIISISQATEDALIRWLPSLKDRVVTIPNGIPIEKFYNAVPYQLSELVPNIPNGAKLLLMVARMDEQKDHRTVIRTMSYLPEDVVLLFVGDGPIRKEYEQMVEKMGLSSRVYFLGIRKDIPRIMKTVDMFILSSHWEGFGLVAVEAMASGLPVIVSDVVGLSDVIGDAGFTFTPGDSEELSKLVMRLLETPSALAEYKVRGIKRASHFDIKNMMDRYINVYNEVLK